MSSILPSDLSKLYYHHFNEIYVHWTDIPVNSDSNALPKILWQTWKDNDILSFGNVQRMKHKHPDWTFVLLNDTECISFFESISPRDDIVNTAYKSYKLINANNGAARSDILRYALMWYFGGIYVDMDAEIYDLNKLHAFGDKYDVILSREPRTLDYAGTERKKIVQWLLVTKPRQKLFANVVKLIYHTLTFDQPKEALKSSYNVPMRELTVWMTGPNMFTRALDVTMIGNTKEENEKILLHGIDYDGLATKKAKDIFWGTATAYSKQKNYRANTGVFRVAIKD